MPVSMKELGIDRLSVAERLALMHEIWDSVFAETGAPPLTDARRAELQRRLAEHEADPADVVPWDQVKAEALQVRVTAAGPGRSGPAGRSGSCR